MTTRAATRPRPTGHQGYSETHPRTEGTAAIARRLARAACATWALPDDVTETAALVVSELASNAVRHAWGPSVRVIVDRPRDDRVYVAVVDRSPHCTPELGTPGEGDVSGRGLVLVDALSDQWGYDLVGPHRRPWGKRCWAELKVGP
ncbi:ATP-binding protein [Streptomyces sp. MBT53]|uniref:ATP-binding protein n=1 Tax=Streptomyces sp. MBT53 TaxID=1488384 RepID=UPI0019113E9D|nr:ATP-binding protein [Streptomyces sp. MBT53]MBK6015809.1 ATP-binding protein [Streptomyces sp. MBT53]